MKELSFLVLLLGIEKSFCLKNVKIKSCSASANQVNKDMRNKAKVHYFLSSRHCVYVFRMAIIALNQLMVSLLEQETVGQSALLGDFTIMFLKTSKSLQCC